MGRQHQPHSPQSFFPAARCTTLLQQPALIHALARQSLHRHFHRQPKHQSHLPVNQQSTNPRICDPRNPNSNQHKQTKRQPTINMRSAFVVAAFAAGALAVPLMEREVVWETDVVYATQYVTVTAGDVAPTAAPPAYPTSSEHWGHRKKKTSSGSKTRTRSKPKPTSSNDSPKASSDDTPNDSPKATSTSSAVQEAAKETAWTSSWATTWSEQAPAYTSEKPAPAPTSYDAPKAYSETPTSTKAASSSKDDSSARAKPTGYQGMVLHHHNIHRANHSAPDIAWSDSLAATAQKI